MSKKKKKDKTNWMKLCYDLLRTIRYDQIGIKVSQEAIRDHLFKIEERLKEMQNESRSQ